MKILKILNWTTRIPDFNHMQIVIIGCKISDFQLLISLPLGRAITRSSLERKVWGTEGLRSDKLLPTAHHRCDRCCPGAMIRKWPHKLVTRFDVVQQE